MKRLFGAVDRHPVLFVLVAVLLAIAGIDRLAHYFLEKPAGYALTQDSVLKKIYGVDSAEDYRQVFLEQGIGQKYYPFVEYIEKARNGKFVNVSNQGTRCHYPNRDFCTVKGGGGEIWMFGGSTTFGYSVKDNETIAAYLSESMPDYRIVNFGAASYYSTIERIRFENLLTEFPSPKAAVFIDGLNDFYFFNVPDESAFTKAYSLILNKEEKPSSFVNDLRARLKRLAIYRLLEEKFGLSGKASVTTASPEQISKAITRLYLNQAMVEFIGDKLGVAVLNVLQPIPLYGVGHKTSQVPREVLNFGDHENSGLAYRKMLMPNGELRHQNSRTLNLANLGINEGMYVDTVHYTPLFNKKIAQEIYKRLSGQLQGQKNSSQRNMLQKM